MRATMPLTLERPDGVDAAIAALLSAPDAVPIAGGTDLLLDLEAGRVRSEHLVSLAGLPWARVERTGEGWSIGSTAPLRRVERSEGLAADHPGFVEAVRSVGSAALRHRATLGGNLGRASPASDLLPILLALDADVTLVGPAGPRRAKLDELLRGSRDLALGRGELIEGVALPPRAPSAYAWQRVRPANDISQVGVAIARPPGADRWAVALGGVLPRPCRVPAAEEALTAPTPSEEEVRRAARIASTAALFASDRRATAEYRRRLVDVLLRRALARASGGARP